MLLRSVQDFEALTGADAPRQVERDLIAACRAGTALILGELPPEGEPDPARHIRADLLRLLITGGTPDCGLHPVGIWLEGAQITGTLDLRFSKGRGRIVLDACRFTDEPQLDQADLAQLSLERSHLPGLSAQWIKLEGDLFLGGLIATGTVDVGGAIIGGLLDCEGATLDGAGGKALNAEGVEVGSHLLLRNLTATGTVLLLGTKIGGQLDCTGATLNGAVDDALMAQRMSVAEGFFFRDLKSITGEIYLDGAHVSDLADDMASWPTRPALPQRLYL